MLGVGRYAAHVPLAVLAGILIRVGIGIIDWPFFPTSWKITGEHGSPDDDGSTDDRIC